MKKYVKKNRAILVIFIINIFALVRILSIVSESLNASLVTTLSLTLSISVIYGTYMGVLLSLLSFIKNLKAQNDDHDEIEKR